MFSIHDNCIFRLCILGNKLVLFGLTFIQIEDCRLDDLARQANYFRYLISTNFYYFDFIGQIKWSFIEVHYQISNIIPIYIKVPWLFVRSNKN